LLNNRLRRNTREAPAIMEEYHDLLNPDFTEEMDVGLYEDLFWNTFKKLPRTCRNVLKLHFSEHTNAEIARILNLSEAYVRKRKSLCTRRMIDEIRGHKDYGRLVAHQTIPVTEPS
jgi:DNA-directed RNA polymerase specialized sigma24 family protein